MPTSNMDPDRTAKLILFEIVPPVFEYTWVVLLLKLTTPKPVLTLSMIIELPPARVKLPPTFNVPTVALLSSCRLSVPPKMLIFPVTDKVELAAPVTMVK